MSSESCFRYHKGTDFQANHNGKLQMLAKQIVVLDTTKVQIFKQITTFDCLRCLHHTLFQIPQRYRFSSKSQHLQSSSIIIVRCFRYHKGTDFQANHNITKHTPAICLLFQIPQRYRFSSKSQHIRMSFMDENGCFRYHKGTDFQANHNLCDEDSLQLKLFQIPQRYRFSSKSQPISIVCKTGRRCFRYHKGTDFQANHNCLQTSSLFGLVVLDTTKVQIFKQITTLPQRYSHEFLLFQIPQRYRFSSKSQRYSVLTSNY